MKYQKILVGISLVAVLIFFFSPQILGYAYSNGDAIQAFYPELSFFAEQLSGDTSFLWSSGMLGGFPLFIDLIGGLTSPLTQFLFQALDVVSAYNVEIFISIAVLFVASFGAARSYLLSRQGSLFVAIVYAFGSHNANWSNNITVANALYLLPILVIAFRRVLHGNYTFYVIGLLATWYALIAGQPQWVVLAYIGVGLLVIIELWLARGDELMRRGIFRALALLCVSAGLGFALAWSQVSPSQLFTDLSARSQGLSFQDAQISSFTPIDWTWYVVPSVQLYKLSAPEQTLYIGIIAVLLAYIAFTIRKSDTRVVPMVILFGFGMLSALRFSPLFWLMHQLPILELFRGSNRWMYIGNFGLAMMAGIGFDFARSHSVNLVWDKARQALGWVFGVLMFGAIVVRLIVIPVRTQLLSYVYAYFDEHFLASRAGGLSVEHYHNSISSLFDALIANVDPFNSIFFVGFASLGVSILIVRRVAVRGFDGPARVATLVLTACSLFMMHPNRTQIIHASVISSAPSLAAYIQATDGRYLSVLSGSAVDQKLHQPFSGRYSISDSIAFQRDLMVPNIGMQYGASSIDGFSNIMTRRIARTIALVGSERATTGDSLAYASMPLQEKLRVLTLRLPVLSMLNVKYLISAYELPATPGLQLIEEVASTRFNIPIYLYENKTVMPRIYFARNVSFVSETDEEKNFKTIIESNTNFANTTFIECADCDSFKNRPTPSDSIAIDAYRDGYLRLTTKTSHDRWLVFSESNLPGWRITIDGRPVQSYMTNYLFHGLPVHGGEHVVEFTYDGVLLR